MVREKKTQQVKVNLTPSLEVALMRLANKDDRKLSDYINRVLCLHVYGHARNVDDIEDSCRDE